MAEYTASKTRYTETEGTDFYRHCGKSGLMLPPIALGLWHNFGSVDNYENMKQMCFTAFDHGITHFDLANNYGPVYGSAEENFGRILREEMSAYRDEMVISTKAGFDMWEGPYGNWGSRKYLIASLDQSLKRMGLPYVDIFYHHRMDPNTPLEETMEALAQIVRSGKALYVGLSNYDGPTMAKAERILDELHCPFIINQNRYSILDRTVEKNGLLKQTYASGRGLICFSPLAQGMLTDKYLQNIPKDSRVARDGRFLHEDQVVSMRPLLTELNDIAAGYNMSLSELAIAWLLNKPEVTTVLIGASKPEQILQNIPKDSRVARDGRFLHEDQVVSMRPLLTELNDIAAGYNMSLSELAIAWLLNKPEVTTVLIGASKPEQILSNLKAAEKQRTTEMEEEELALIEKAVNLYHA